jgi:peptidoglycan/LPS O-acetylase OafA/YrhL
MARPTLRDDIDALRAVAEGLVILFHFGVLGFSGGFVGVDVFFVISGFLIGGIIDRELTARQFSLVAFYERRVQRIFPALFAVLAVTAAIAALLLYPPDYERFGRSAGAAALFRSNILFFNTSGYWDAAATSKPLLHTWSLAVVSFVANVWAVEAEPAAVFGFSHPVELGPWTVNVISKLLAFAAAILLFVWKEPVDVFGGEGERGVSRTRQPFGMSANSSRRDDVQLPDNCVRNNERLSSPRFREYGP